MSQMTVEGKLPGWTLLVPIVWCIASLAIVWACKEAGLLWEFGVPAGITCVIASVVIERAIERKYLKSKTDRARPLAEKSTGQ